MNIDQRTQVIKNKAHELGFQYVGISKAAFLEEEAPRLEQWLNENRHGKMQYMENHFDLRLDPTKLVEGAKSVISLALNYFPEESQVKDSYKIAKYAYGQDYHHVIKSKLKALTLFIQQEIGEVNGRGFVDSAPVLDKAWGKKSGLGWIGKNSNLITKQQGSFFFLAELIVDLELNEDGPIKDYCGTCTACMDHCPTDAIYEPYKVDGNKCISYLTIELKDELIPTEFKNKMDDWAFGCDICQDVCPWNRHSKAHQEPLFTPHPNLLSYSKKEWTEITQELFNEVFKKSAVKRTKFTGFLRNLQHLKDGE